MKSIKHAGVLLAVAVLSTAVLQADDKPASTNMAATTKADEMFPDAVIAKGKGFEIKRSRLDEGISSIRANAMAHGRELTPADLPMVEKTAFDHMLQVQLLGTVATADDKARAAVEADKQVDIIKKRAPSQEVLDKQLKSMNLTMAEFRARLIEDATALQVLRDKVSVSDATVKKYYDDNPSQFEEPEMVRASHILLVTTDKTGKELSDDEKKAKRKMMDDLLKRARAGEDFAKLAKEYSDDPGSKDTGGEYTFPRGRMVKEFEAAAFTLQTNQISDVVTTQYGYHIIKMSEKIPAKKLAFDDKVSAEIKTYLENQEIEKILPETISKLKKDANLQILDEQIKTLEEASDDAAAGPKGAMPKAPMPK